MHPGAAAVLGGGETVVGVATGVDPALLVARDRVQRVGRVHRDARLDGGVGLHRQRGGQVVGARLPVAQQRRGQEVGGRRGARGDRRQRGRQERGGGDGEQGPGGSGRAHGAGVRPGPGADLPGNRQGWVKVRCSARRATASGGRHARGAPLRSSWENSQGRSAPRLPLRRAWVAALTRGPGPPPAAAPATGAAVRGRPLRPGLLLRARRRRPRPRRRRHGRLGLAVAVVGPGRFTASAHHPRPRVLGDRWRASSRCTRPWSGSAPARPSTPAPSARSAVLPPPAATVTGCGLADRHRARRPVCSCWVQLARRGGRRAAARRRRPRRAVTPLLSLPGAWASALLPARADAARQPEGHRRLRLGLGLAHGPARSAALPMSGGPPSSVVAGRRAPSGPSPSPDRPAAPSGPDPEVARRTASAPAPPASSPAPARDLTAVVAPAPVGTPRRRLVDRSRPPGPPRPGPPPPPPPPPSRTPRRALAAASVALASLGGRLLLAAVLILAAVAKVLDPPASVRAVRAYDLLPESVVVPFAHALPFVELELAAVLLLGVAVRAAGVATAAL